MKELYKLDEKLASTYTDVEDVNKSIRIQQHKLAVAWEALRSSYLATFESNMYPTEEYVWNKRPMFSQGLLLHGKQFANAYVPHPEDYFANRIDSIWLMQKEINESVLTPLGYLKMCRLLESRIRLAAYSKYSRTMIVNIFHKTQWSPAIEDYAKALAKINYVNVIVL